MAQKESPFGPGTQAEPIASETSVLNGGATPKVSRGETGIQAAFDDGDPVMLKRGVYIVESPLVMGDDELRGLGRRGKSVLRAGSSFPAGEPLVKTGPGSTTPVISGVDIDCRGNAQDGVLLGTDSRDGNVSYCRIRHAQRDAIRVVGGYNHLIERVRCQHRPRRRWRAAHVVCRD